jgi:hypothetical protein
MAVERQVRMETSVPPILGKEKTPSESQFRAVWGLAFFLEQTDCYIPFTNFFIR